MPEITLPRGELRELCLFGRQTFWLDALGRVFRSQERKPLQYVASSAERFFYDRLDPSLAAVYKLSDEGLRMYADFLERIAIMVRQGESQ